MKPLRDTEGAEVKHLVAACELVGKKVLEIGCGDGALTRQYVRLARQVVGIDPAESELQIARKKDRRNWSMFVQGEGESLPFQSKTFDIAIFASSL